MAQLMRAQAVAAITDTGNFTGGSVYASVGGPAESSPDTGDYWNGNDNETDVLELRMTDLSGSIPAAGTCTVTIYETTCDTDVAPASGGTTPTFDLEVYEGATQRAVVTGVTPTDSAFTVYNTLTFTATSITDWSDVRIRFTSNGTGGAGGNRRGVAVSYMEISTPNASTPVTVTPAAVALTVATPSPTVTYDVTASPAAVGLTLATLAPTVSMSPRVYLNTSESKAGASEMTVTAFTATTVTFTDPSGPPTGGSLYIGVENPLTGDIGWLSGCTVTDVGIVVTPAAVGLTVATQTPAVTYDVTVSPAAVALTLAPQTPVVTYAIDVQPTTVALTLAPLTPAVTYDVSVSPATVGLTLTGQAPTVTYDVGITPNVIGLTLTANAPVVDVDADVTVQPNVVGLTLAPQTPAVTYDVTVAPATVGLTLAAQAPTVTYSVDVTPATVALTLAPLAPTVTYDVTVAPAVVALTLAANNPTVTIPGTGFQVAWATQANHIIQVTAL